MFVAIPGIHAGVTDLSDDNAFVLWNVDSDSVIGSGLSHFHIPPSTTSPMQVLLQLSPFRQIIRIYILVNPLYSIKMDYICFMNWQDHIVSDERVLLGKPTIKGTRIAVEFIIDRLAEGWTEEDILANYPRVTKNDLRAVFAFVRDAIRDGLLIHFPSKSA